MKLALGSDEELAEEIAKEDRWSFLKGGLIFLILFAIGGGVFWLAYNEGKQKEEAEFVKKQKMERLVASGETTAGTITKAWERFQNGSRVGFEVDYDFRVNNQNYKGHSFLRTDPQLLVDQYGNSNNISVVYEPNDPANNATVSSLNIFKENNK